MRRRNKVLLIVLLVIVLTIALGYFYFFHFGGLRHTIEAQISEVVGEESPVKIRIGHIAGNLISGIVVEDVTIEYVDSTRSVQLLSVARLTAGYSLSDLWSGRYFLDYAYLKALHNT